MSDDLSQAWSVSRLARAIKRRVEADAPAVWVRGEVTGIKRYPSGHLYFSLRDETARVDCTMWRSAANQLRAPVSDGTEVFALGCASVWEERTALRFNVTQLLPTALVGAQAQEVERVKRALLADGLLDPARKRQLPEFPARIAVITSIAGAVVHDIITVARQRWPAVELLVVNSVVQGDGAALALVRAVRVVCRLESIDCCIIGRGGGGREDLVAFNDEALCRAIAACPVPVISAVGHEVDVTLADLVADVRAATPSQAAEFALPDRRDVSRRTRTQAGALDRILRSFVRARRARLDRTRDRLGGALLQQVHRSERRLTQSRARMTPAIRRALDRKQNAIRRLAAHLHALSPLAVLGRGYAVARGPDGRVLARTHQFITDAPFTLMLSDGMVQARVTVGGGRGGETRHDRTHVVG